MMSYKTVAIIISIIISHLSLLKMVLSCTILNRNDLKNCNAFMEAWKLIRKHWKISLYLILTCKSFNSFPWILPI